MSKLRLRPVAPRLWSTTEPPDTRLSSDTRVPAIQRGSGAIEFLAPIFDTLRRTSCRLREAKNHVTYRLLELLERLFAVVTVVHRPAERRSLRMLSLGVGRTAVGALGPGVVARSLDAGVWSSHGQTLSPNSLRSSLPCSVTISMDHSGLQTSRRSTDSTSSTPATARFTSSVSMSRAGHPE